MKAFAWSVRAQMTGKWIQNQVSCLIIEVYIMDLSVGLVIWVQWLAWCGMISIWDHQVLIIIMSSGTLETQSGVTIGGVDETCYSQLKQQQINKQKLVSEVVIAWQWDRQVKSHPFALRREPKVPKHDTSSLWNSMSANV